MAFEKKTTRDALSSMTAEDLAAFYADMRMRNAERNENHVSWFDGPPACICRSDFRNGFYWKYTYTPTCPRCPDKTK